MKKLFVYFLFLAVFCQYSWGSTNGANTPKKLANGMTVETYKIKKTFDFKGKNSICNKSEFDYEIEWPIDGPQPLLNKCRKWIIQQVKGNENPVNGELSSNSLQEAIEERIKNNSPSYDLEYDASEGIVEDKIIIRINADDAKTCLSSHIEELWCGAPRTEYFDAVFNLLNNGEEMTYSMFPPIEKMRPFIWSHLLNWDEPVENAQYGDYRNIDYPEQLPEIIDDNLFFQWPRVFQSENLTATIPISKVYPILSAQLRKFLPVKYAEDSEANADSNNPKPTRELLFSYGNEGVTNGDNEYISKEFRDLIKVAALMPSENPEGRGFYDEVLYFWQGGEDLDGSAVYDAQILSVSDNKAFGVVTFGSKEYNQSHKVTLIKEKFEDRDGKTAVRWVVDDFEDDYNGGKKKLLKETINKAGEEFSNGLGQRLMNDPDESGFMSAAEKREYLQQVDEFLKAYKKYKSGGDSSNIAPTVDQVFSGVEQLAEFPGGQAALMKWLSNNIKYPEEAQKEGVQGRVTVRMIIEKDGSISSPAVVKGVRGDLDEEAVRVVMRMPKWLPGKNNGQAVRSYFTLPIAFKLPIQEAK